MTARPGSANGGTAEGLGKSTVIAALTAVLALAFQLQITPELWGNPVRVSAADAVAPILAAALVARGDWRSVLPRLWRVRHLWAILGAMTLAMTAALLVGRLNTGTWPLWAVVNKYAGWFALLFYFVAGGVVAMRFGDAIRRIFLQVFLAGSWIFCAYSLIGYVMGFLNIPFFPEGGFNRPQGFLDNPNAFAFLVAVTIALQAPYLKAGQLFAAWIHMVGLTLSLAVIVLSASRSAWLGLGAALLILFLTRSFNLRASALAATAAAAIVILLLYAAPFLRTLAVDSPATQANADVVTGGYVLNNPIIVGADYGARTRLSSTLEALDLWLEAPLLGIGLGGFLQPQIEAGAVAPVVLHNTLLWLLTETGLVGAIVFVGFFLVAMRALICGPGENKADVLFCRATFAAMVVFAGASLGMEAMYQRHLWFVLGLALAVPASAPRPTAHEASCTGSSE